MLSGGKAEVEGTRTTPVLFPGKRLDDPITSVCWAERRQEWTWKADFRVGLCSGSLSAARGERTWPRAAGLLSDGNITSVRLVCCTLIGPAIRIVVSDLRVS